MSTRKTLPQVIVRSFDDEPVPLAAHAVDTDKSRVFVGKTEAKRPISLPVDDVFDYSQELFTILSDAYRSGKKSKLTELYDDLRRKRACNRYQDVLDLVHEKEPEIADLGSAADRGE